MYTIKYDFSHVYPPSDNFFNQLTSVFIGIIVMFSRPFARNLLLWECLWIGLEHAHTKAETTPTPDFFGQGHIMWHGQKIIKGKYSKGKCQTKKL